MGRRLLVLDEQSFCTLMLNTDPDAEVNREHANFVSDFIDYKIAIYASVPQFFKPFPTFDSCPKMNSTRKIMSNHQLTFILEANYYLKAHNAHLNFASSGGIAAASGLQLNTYNSTPFTSGYFKYTYFLQVCATVGHYSIDKIEKEMTNCVYFT